jgi:hypothetical protein
VDVVVAAVVVVVAIAVVIVVAGGAIATWLTRGATWLTRGAIIAAAAVAPAVLVTERVVAQYQQ